MTADLGIRPLLDGLTRLADVLDAHLCGRHQAQVQALRAKRMPEDRRAQQLEALELGQQQTRHGVERAHAQAREAIASMLVAGGCYPGPVREGGPEK